MLSALRSKKRRHVIVLGRVSDEIRAAVIKKYGEDNVIEAVLDMHGDQEAFFTLFPRYYEINIRANAIRAEEEKRQAIADSLEGAHVTFVSSDSGQNVSARFLSKLLGAGHLKRRIGVASIHGIMPQGAFLRADRAFHKMEMVDNQDPAEQVRIDEHNAVAAEDAAAMAKNAGFDSITLVTPHSRDTANIFRTIFGYDYFRTSSRSNSQHATVLSWAKMYKTLAETFNYCAPRWLKVKPRSTSLSATSIFADELRERLGSAIDNGGVMIGAPDGGNKLGDLAIERAADLSAAIRPTYKDTDPTGRTNMFFITKTRTSSSTTEITDFSVGGGGSARGKTAILIDDIMAGGSTIYGAAEKLKEEGCSRVIACITHGVLVEKEQDQAIINAIGNPDLDELWLTDTVPGAKERFDRYVESLKEQANSTNEQEKEQLEAKIEKAREKIKFVTVAPLVVADIDRVHRDRGLEFRPPAPACQLQPQQVAP